MFFEYDDFDSNNNITGINKWIIDTEGNNILINDLTGRVLKTVPLTRLPDGTIMDCMCYFRVESARKILLDNIGVINKGSLLVAKKFPDGNIGLFTNNQAPYLILDNAIAGKDFSFIVDLSKLNNGDLKIKLKRVLEIENYELACEIRDELLHREKEIAKPKVKKKAKKNNCKIV